MTSEPREPPARPRPGEPPFRADIPEAQHDAWSFLHGEKVIRRHAKVAAAIRRRIEAGKPIRVTFVVSERSKWNADGIVQAMLEQGWQVDVALHRMERRGESDEDARATYEQERRFFADLSVRFVDAYDWELGLARPVESLDADVVFLQQPWRMEHFPQRLTGRALPAYLHYGVPLMANLEMHHHIPGFHAYLWRRYVATELHRTMHLDHDAFAHDRVRVVGYPRFDAYLTPTPDPADVPQWRHPGTPRRRVVVAPHHSVGPTSLRMATFPWSHGALLGLVDAHPEISWVYKPHPRLRHAVVQAGVMSGSDYDEYEAQWHQRPNTSIEDGPHYLDVFRTSDALITDSGSFLAEYLPTGAPILRLVSQEAVAFNLVGQQLRPALYEVHDVDGLRSTFERVVIGSNDPLADLRRTRAALFQPDDRTSAQRIVEELTESLAESR